MKKIGKILLAILMLALFAVMIVIIVKVNGNTNTSVSNAVSLNEVMTSNKGAVPDENGEFFDWVELRNSSSSAVDISGWGLSDSILELAKFVFPSGTVIAPDGYMVVYCCGETKGGLYAPFKLSADDDLVLLDSTGRIVESISLKPVSKNATLGKDPSTGLWNEFSMPSPGYPNTDEGVAAYQENKHTANTVDGLYINEFMASNASVCYDENGVYSDWIELYNANDTALDISGFYISDDLTKPMKYAFPEGTTIEAHGCLLVFCSKTETVEGSNEIHAPFGLLTYKEDVVLSMPTGAIIDSYSYSEQTTDVSMARTPDGTGDFVPCSKPSPGFPNTDEGYNQAAAKYAFAPSDIYISEMMGANYAFLKQSNGDFPDWLEIHNTGSEAVSLGGYSLSDNPKNPAKWRFPDITLAPGQYLVVLATGRDIREGSQLETNFKISANGETVFLFNPEAKPISKLSCPKFHADESVGCDDAGHMRVYTTPTPGSANGEGTSGYAQTPEFSLISGAYSGSQQVSISVPEGCTVRYTLNGSEPTSSSALYDGTPITISKTGVVRAAAFRDGYSRSDIATAAYLIDSPHTLSVIMIATDKAEFDNIYQNYNQEIEIPAHFDLINENGEKEFDSDAVIRIFGAYSRQKEQKGIAVIARAGYGSSRFDNPFFSSRDFDSYKAFILRASGQESTISRMRDVLITSLVDEGTDLAVQAYRQCVVYINGDYRGVYNMREKVNKHYLAQHYNIDDPDSINLLVGNGNKSGYVLSGTNEEYMSLVDYAVSHDMRVQENYDYMCRYIDTANLAEYTAMQIYVGNTDTGNIKYWSAPNHKWQWIVYDFCWAMNSSVGGTKGYEWNAIEKYFSEKGHGVGSMFSNKLIKSLLNNPDFKEMFLQSCAKMANEVFEESKVIARVDELEAKIDDEMKRDVLLWSDMSYEGWKRSVNRLREFATNRKGYFVYQLKTYFGLSSEKCMELFGISGSNPKAS